MQRFAHIFKDKTVLITGHTGFKGSWLSIWLNHLGARVIGISHDVPSTPSNFDASGVSGLVDNHHINVQDRDSIRSIIETIQPDFVFHLAAQALVRSSYQNPLETITTNALGTANILDALRYLDKKTIAIMITSDKVYDNLEWEKGYCETDRLGGKDPYSASKGMAELAIKAYYESFFKKSDSNIRIGITRAGNVIGGGDWARDRIVPDCMKAWSENKIVDIRSPSGTRPWQHVLEPLSGYLSLAVELTYSNHLHGRAYNFGPSSNENYPVRELIEEMKRYWNNVRWNDVSLTHEHPHEASLLKLNCDKALFDLQWQPTMQFEETIRMTVEWYKVFYEGEKSTMLDYSLSQINEYFSLAKKRNIAWACE